MPTLPRVQLEILRELQSHGEVHAYELRRSIGDRIGKSSVYAAISALEAKGLLASRWGDREREGFPPRKFLTLTGEGFQALLEVEPEVPKRALRFAPEGG